MSDNAGHSQGKTIFAYKICKETKTSVKIEFWSEGGNVVAEFLNTDIVYYIAQIENAVFDGAEYLNYLDGTYVMPSNLLVNLKRDFSSYIQRVNDADNSGAYTPNCKDTQSRAKASAMASLPSRQISSSNTAIHTKNGRTSIVIGTRKL